MKLPIWYKTKTGKWITLQHFADGTTGLTMQQALENRLLPQPGYGRGMWLMENDFFFDGTDRFLTIEESGTNAFKALRLHMKRQREQA